jgi:tripartite-type tricarboxylate transporter receptor subunit TctC
MAISNGYATLAQVKSALRITDSVDDTLLEQAIESASRRIDGYCGRWFYKTTSTAILVYPFDYYNLPVQDIAQLLTFSRTNPKPLNIASAGSGTSQHLTAELLKEMAKVDMMHVPYKGSSPAMNDLIAGHVDLMFDNLIAATPYIQSGKLKLLAVGSSTRSRLFPNTPAVHEVLPGFESVTWMGVVAPPGTPAPVVEKLSQAISTAMKTPKIRKQIEDLQAEPLGSTAAAMAEAIRKDGLRWSQVIRSAKITVD